MKRRHAHSVVATAVLMELALAAIGLALGAMAGIRPLDSFSWSLRDTAIGAVAALPLLVAFRLAWRSPVPAMRQIRDELERLLPEMFATTSTAGLAVVSLAAGVGEEILFRGFLQGWLETILGSFGGLLTASWLFGAAHPITAGYVVVATLMGAYLGALWQVSGNLMVPIVTHALYDLLVLWVLLGGVRR